MSKFSHNYKYIDLTSSYTITPLDPYYLYVNPKDIALSINLPSISYPKGGGISYKIYNLSDNNVLYISSNITTYVLNPKHSVEVTSKDSDYIFRSEEESLKFDDPVFGICLLQTGGGTGKWCHVDRNGVPITLDDNYFNNHPIYKELVEVRIDGQDVLHIPKFWVKYETITSDNDPRGLPKGSSIKYISPIELPGYHIHPAFIYSKNILNYIYIGINLSGPLEQGNKLNSYKSTTEFIQVNTTNTVEKLKTYANNRGAGWRLVTIYQWAAFQLLTIANNRIINKLKYAAFIINWCYYTNFKIYLIDPNNLQYKQTNIVPCQSTIGVRKYIIKMKSDIDDVFDFNDLFIPEIVTDDYNLGTYGNSTYDYNHGVGTNNYIHYFCARGNGVPFACAFTGAQYPSGWYLRIAKD